MSMVGHNSTGKSIVSFISKITVGLCWHFTAAVFKSLASAVVISEGEQISGEGGTAVLHLCTDRAAAARVACGRSVLGWASRSPRHVHHRGCPAGRRSREDTAAGPPRRRRRPARSCHMRTMYCTSPLYSPSTLQKLD